MWTSCFFCNDTATTEIYTLSLHDALPICLDYHLDENTTIRGFARYIRANVSLPTFSVFAGIPLNPNAHQRNEFMLYKGRSEEHTSELQSHLNLVCRLLLEKKTIHRTNPRL